MICVHFHTSLCVHARRTLACKHTVHVHWLCFFHRHWSCNIFTFFATFASDYNLEYMFRKLHWISPAPRTSPIQNVKEQKIWRGQLLAPRGPSSHAVWNHDWDNQSNIRLWPKQHQGSCLYLQHQCGRCILASLQIIIHNILSLFVIVFSRLLYCRKFSFLYRNLPPVYHLSWASFSV